MKFRFILLVSTLLIFSECAAYGQTSRAEVEAKELVSEITSRMPVKNEEIYGLLRRRDASGKRTELPFKYSVLVGRDYWIDRYEARDAQGNPLELLEIRKSPGGTNLYAYRSTNQTQGVRLEQSDVNVPFAGSDFWLSDLGLEFFYWPGQKVVKREMRKGRACTVVESVNPSESNGGYGRVLSWLDKETGGLVRAEGYDRQDKLLKEFSIKSFKKVAGVWQLKEIEIRNEETDSRTRIEYQFDLPSTKEKE